MEDKNSGPNCSSHSPSLIALNLTILATLENCTTCNSVKGLRLIVQMTVRTKNSITAMPDLQQDWLLPAVTLQNTVVCPHVVFMCHIILTVNSNYLPKQYQAIGLYNAESLYCDREVNLICRRYVSFVLKSVKFFKSLIKAEGPEFEFSFVFKVSTFQKITLFFMVSGAYASDTDC
jgi:hypothetical protein